MHTTPGIRLCILAITIATGIPLTTYGKEYPLTGGYWQWDIYDLKGKIHLPIEAYRHTLYVPPQNLIRRSQLFLQDSRIEPVYMSFAPPYKESMHKFLSRYTLKPAYLPALQRYLHRQPAGTFPSRKPSRKKFLRVILNPQALQWIDLEAFRQRFAAPAYTIVLPQTPSPTHRSARLQLVQDMKHFISAEKHRQLQHKVQHGLSLTAHQDLLPFFAKKMLNKHVIFQGPNCFHAAIAFQETSFLTMDRTNLREETNHHHLMINHDELWHILNRYFYEINPMETTLKYGDIIIFLDVPTNHALHTPAKFRWIVHATTYLFNNFVFSKGSKSPNTPYTIKTLDDEWNIWSRLASRPAIKVYRRSFNNLRHKSMMTSRTSWLY